MIKPGRAAIRLMRPWARRLDAYQPWRQQRVNFVVRGGLGGARDGRYKGKDEGQGRSFHYWIVDLTTEGTEDHSGLP